MSTELAPSPTAPEAEAPDASPISLASLPDLSAEVAPEAPGATLSTLDLLADVELDITVELGRRRLSLGEVTRLQVGSVVDLDTLAGEPLVVYANGRRIATGEAVVVDGHFGVRIQSLEGRAAA